MFSDFEKLIWYVSHLLRLNDMVLSIDTSVFSDVIIAIQINRSAYTLHGPNRMSTLKRTAGWIDMPTEIQRKIFSFLPYWEIQRSRGAGRLWKRIADSIDPNAKDAESRNVFLQCLSLVNEIERRWQRWGIATSSNWRGETIYYPRYSDFSDGQKVTDVVKMLQWDATGFKTWSWIEDDFLPHAYVHGGIKHCLTKVEFCHCSNGHCENKSSIGCNRNMCKACCSDAHCHRHVPRSRHARPCTVESCQNESSMRCSNSRCGECCGCTNHRRNRFCSYR